MRAYCARISNREMRVVVYWPVNIFGWYWELFTCLQNPRDNLISIWNFYECVLSQATNSCNLLAGWEMFLIWKSLNQIIQMVKICIFFIRRLINMCNWQILHFILYAVQTSEAEIKILRIPAYMLEPVLMCTVHIIAYVNFSSVKVITALMFKSSFNASIAIDFLLLFFRDWPIQFRFI